MIIHVGAGECNSSPKALAKIDSLSGPGTHILSPVCLWHRTGSPAVGQLGLGD